MNREKTSVFRIEWRGGEPTCVEAKRVAIKGSWWHIAKKGGGVVKINGGGGWRETIIDAWAEAIGREYAMEHMIRAGIFDGDWYEQSKKARHATVAALEDMKEWGEFLGQVHEKNRGGREPNHAD